MRPADEHRVAEREAFDVLRADPRHHEVTHPAHPLGPRAVATTVRVLRRLRRLWRDALHPVAHPAVRRPTPDRQRHRLLVDLRRQPADHAVHDRRRRARPGMEQLVVRGQRRVRPRAAPRRRHPRPTRPGSPPTTRPRASRPTLVAELAGPCRSGDDDAIDTRRRAIERAPRAPRLPSTAVPISPTRPTRSCPRSVWLVGGDGWAYDIGFGGLDHVLLDRPGRERARPRHRGVLQHRRAGVEGDAPRRGREVRVGRQGDLARRISACSP